MKIIAAMLISTIFVSFLLSKNAMAECKGSQNLPSQQLFVSFESNGDQIVPSEERRLRQWVYEINSRYPIQNWVFVIGGASKRETEPERLAMKRAVAVTKRIIDDGLVNAPFQMKIQIYPSEGAIESSSETREVTVQVSPGCPNNCCDGN
ncbi:OmpA family protein [Burkholderia ubonensis]|uniref:OmpA family protein n=1 Tax=Burkholderia ubonensis TaxID=101571 RepID=UPI000B025D14|nr:OmpA family protein [Burkholderia ubonensis]